MPQGLQIIGDHGYTQIDSDFANYVFRSKGTVTVPSGSTSTTFSVTGDFPIVVIRSLSNYAVVFADTRSGSTWTYRAFAHSGGATFDYYVFDKMPTGVTPSNFGVEIRDAAGNLSWHSDYPPMRIVGSIKIPDASSLPYPGTSLSAPSGVYAAGLSIPRYRMALANQSTALLSMDGLLISSTGVSVAHATVAAFPAQGGVAQPVGSQLLLVDVANL